MRVQIERYLKYRWVEMKEIIKEKYRKELEEMSNSELLFEFEFSCNEIERLSRIINNGPYEQQLLSYEMVRKRICKEVILNRMGGSK